MYATGQQNSTLKIVFRLNGNKVTNGINIDKMEASATGILSWFSKLYGIWSYLNSVLLRYRFIWHRVVGSCVSVFSLVYELLVSIVGVVKVVLVLLLVHCRDQGRQSGICQSHSYTAEGSCLTIRFLMNYPIKGDFFENSSVSCFIINSIYVGESLWLLVKNDKKMGSSYFWYDTTRFTFDCVDSQPRKMGVRVKLGLTWVDQHIHLASGEAELELKFKTFSCKKGSSSTL